MKALMALLMLCALMAIMPARAADVVTTFETPEQSELFFALL